MVLKIRNCSKFDAYSYTQIICNCKLTEPGINISQKCISPAYLSILLFQCTLSDDHGEVTVTKTVSSYLINNTKNRGYRQTKSVFSPHDKVPLKWP